MFEKLIIGIVMLLAATASAQMKTIDTGPFTLEVDTSGLGDVNVSIGDPGQMADYTEYWIRMGGDQPLNMYIDDYGNQTDVSQERLMKEAQTGFETDKFDWIPINSIGGKQGVLANITLSDGSGIWYSAAYSPDGVGSRGSIIATISSGYSEEVTKNFLSKMRIERR